MPTTSVKGLLSRLSHSGRDMWERQFGEKDQTIEALCERLLTLRGESSAILVADEIIERLKVQTDSENIAFFEYLLNDMQPNQEKLTEAIHAYLEDPNPHTANLIAANADARHMQLFRMLSTSPRGPSLLYTSPSPRDKRQSRMPSSA